METGPARFSHVAEPALEPAPSLGEHTRDIARTLLDLSETEIEKLIESGVLEEGGRQ
jgi:crotonobetainyl-CoA:carnitine CoA-transferase CaiB-like acyl-CoA transferase